MSPYKATRPQATDSLTFTNFLTLQVSKTHETCSYSNYSYYLPMLIFKKKAEEGYQVKGSRFIKCNLCIVGHLLFYFVGRIWVLRKNRGIYNLEVWSS